MKLTYRTAFMGSAQGQETAVIIGFDPNAPRELLIDGKPADPAKAIRAGMITEDWADGFEDGQNCFDGTYEFLDRAGVVVRRRVLLAAQMFDVPDELQSDWGGRNIVTAWEIGNRAFFSGKPIGDLIYGLTQIDDQVNREGLA